MIIEIDEDGIPRESRNIVDNIGIFVYGMRNEFVVVMNIPDMENWSAVLNSLINEMGSPGCAATPKKAFAHYTSVLHALREKAGNHYKWIEYPDNISLELRNRYEALANQIVAEATQSIAIVWARPEENWVDENGSPKRDCLLVTEHVQTDDGWTFGKNLSSHKLTERDICQRKA